MACEMCGLPPHELLELSQERLRFTIGVAEAVEEWRWENWSELFGG